MNVWLSYVHINVTDKKGLTERICILYEVFFSHAFRFTGNEPECCLSLLHFDLLNSNFSSALNVFPPDIFDT